MQCIIKFSSVYALVHSQEIPFNQMEVGKTYKFVKCAGIHDFVGEAKILDIEADKVEVKVMNVPGWCDDGKTFTNTLQVKDYGVEWKLVNEIVPMPSDADMLEAINSTYSLNLSDLKDLTDRRFLTNFSDRADSWMVDSYGSTERLKELAVDRFKGGLIN